MLLVGLRAAGGPLPHLAGAEARLAAGGQALVEQLQVHGGRVWQPLPHATRQVPGPRGRGLPPRLRAAGGRGPREGGRRGGDQSRSRRGRGHPGDRRRPGVAPEPHEVYVLNKPKGVVSTAQDTHGRPDRGRAGAVQPPPLPGGAPRRRQHRADPPHQRRRAGRPPHAPALRRGQGLPRPHHARAGCRRGPWRR